VSEITELTLDKWLELLVVQGSVENSVNAIRIQMEIDRNANAIAIQECREAAIVLCADGTFAAAKPGFVFFQALGKSVTKYSIVHPDLAKDEHIREYLAGRCGITETGDELSLVAFLSDCDDSLTADQWDEFWNIVAVSYSSLDNLTFEIKASGKELDLLFKNCLGAYVSAQDLLLEGSILKRDEGDDQWIIDRDFADRHRQIISSLEITDTPKLQGGLNPFLDEYTIYATELLAPGRTKAAVSKELNNAPTVPTHSEILRSGSLAARGRFTSWVLRNSEGLKRWHGHVGFEIDSPTLHMIKHHGYIETSMGPRLPERSLLPSASRFSKVAAVSNLEAHLTEGLGLLTLLSELPTEDLEQIAVLVEDETDHLIIAEVFSQICSRVPVRSKVPCLKGSEIVKLPPEDVAVISKESLLNDYVRIEKPVLFVQSEDGAQELRALWGFKEDIVEFQVGPQRANDPVPLEQEFIYLKIIKGNEVRGKMLVLCEKIWLTIPGKSGLNTIEVDFRLDGDSLYVAVEGDDWSETVLKVANAELRLELSADQIKTVLENRVNNKVRLLTQNVMAQTDDVSRVKTLFTIDELSSLLPPQVLKEIGAYKNDSRVLAELVLAVHGPQLLKEAKSILNRKGFATPTTWTGTEKTVKFVTELGFEHSYAGFKAEPRPEHRDVLPYVEPITLREYQASLVSQIRTFIDNKSSSGSHRALLYLPTGAGKTLITVQALLESLQDGKFEDRPILWIAQSDELCEQAARTFEEVWSTTGRGGVLSLDRLWSINEAFHANYPDEHAGQVVVATIQKLVTDGVVNGGERYDWLRNAGVVIIDEAHKAGERSYTDVLNWLETGVGRKKVDQRPLLGLTATPVRKIKSRFGEVDKYLRIEVPEIEGISTRTDVQYLREIGVLATPKFEVLKGVEVEALENTKMKPNEVWLPTAVEEQLAENMVRNQAIIQSIMGLPSEHSVIVFALSVAHAQLLAALLKMNGISAAAVSGDTQPGVRRHLINNFRKGKIQVLTNFGVLTTGFDAPKVEAVYVTRPTFSPSLYLQMIGRGLRGPLHGGTAECLIVTVEDNLRAFSIDAIFEKMSSWLSGATDVSPFDSPVAETEEDIESQPSEIDAD
jgi:superfamily II DNA or RNA helicase